VQKSNCSRQELERKQERRGEIKEKEGEQSTSFKNEQSRSITANIAKASSLAKKTRDTSTVGSNRTCSHGRSGENDGGNGAPSTESRV